MADCEYWKEIVAKLLTSSNWAAHVLSTLIEEEGSNFEQALECVERKEIIVNTIYAYDDWSAQPYCDQILAQFKQDEVMRNFGGIDNPSENMKTGVLGLFDL